MAPAHSVVDLDMPPAEEIKPKISPDPTPPQNLDFLEMIARAYAVSPTELYQKDMAVFLDWLRSHYHIAEPKEGTSSSWKTGMIALAPFLNKQSANPVYAVCNTLSGNVTYSVGRTHVTHTGKGKLTAEQAFEMALLASLNPVMQTNPLKLTGSAEDQALLKAACDKLNLRATCSVNVSPEMQADTIHFIGKVYDKVNEAKSPAPLDTPTNSQPTPPKNEAHLYDTIAPESVKELKKQLSEFTADLKKLSHNSGQISAQIANWGGNLDGDEQLSQQVSDKTRTDILAYKESLERLSQLKTEFDQKLETLKADATIDQTYIERLKLSLDSSTQNLDSLDKFLNHPQTGAISQFNMLIGDGKKLEFPAEVKTLPDQDTDSEKPDLTAEFNQVSQSLSSRPGYENDIEGVHPEMKNALRAAYIVASGSHDKSLVRVDFLISVLISMENKFKIKQPPQFDAISDILKQTGHIDKNATRDEALTRLVAPSSQPA
ncbi:MAG: hypothetical protein J0L77_04500 [Alphaproteobacteria bacterium]|nr:hypothetical protein [Alphaproteobacteria bacterium]